MPPCPNPRRQGAFLTRKGRKGRPESEGMIPMYIFIAATPPLRRLPGLFRRWELAQVIAAGEDYRVEDAGTASDGTPLYAIYTSMPDARAADGGEAV